MRALIVSLSLILTAIMTPAHALAPIEEVTTGSGVTAWMMRDDTNPIVSIRFSFAAGSVYDPEGKVGLAQLIAATLDEGAGPLSSQDFQGQLEDHSITLRFSAGQDRFSGEILTLKDTAPEAIRLATLALTEPRFDAEAVERMRGQLIASLRQEAEDPNTRAREAMAAQLFGTHPYARGTQELMAGLPSVTQADLKGFVDDFLVKDGLFISVVGDVTRQDAVRMIDAIFGQLPETGARPSIADVTPIFEKRLVIVEKEIPQTSVLMAQRGIDRHDPEFYSAYVLNYILGGGGFASRLYEEVREKRGLAYSVYSYLLGNDQVDYWMIGSGTQNARVAQTVDVIQDQWRKALEDGVNAEEVMNAKTYLTGSFPLRFSSSETISSILLSMQEDDLPMDFLETRNQQVEAVTLESVNRVAKKLLTPDALTTVLVGKPEGPEGIE